MSPPAKPLSLRRKLAFAAILTAGLLALLLGAFEFALRVMGYGYSADFARRERLPDGSTVWRENRWCTAPFFSPELVRRPQPFRLPGKKAPGTIRIFVLGSSAAMGDPEASFSLARMLEAMLRSAYPKNNFDVVNAAITAINSHVVREIARDCARLEPDLLIVYEGHNEVIGPFGPAGVFASFPRSERAVRAAIWLKRTRTGQLLASVGRRATPQKWGGMEMFLQQQIADDDPRLEVVRAHFRANLLAIASAAQRAGAATLVCTTLANQGDFAPFLSLHGSNLSDAQRREWQTWFDSGNEAVRLGHDARAEAAYRAALEIDDRHADLTFRLARLLQRSGRGEEARSFFQRALDLDALRFRADSSLNRIIRELPAAAPHLDLRVVDLLAPATPTFDRVLPGDALLYEHVHLTFRGTHEIARDLLTPIASELAKRGLLPHATPLPLDASQARLQLAFTAYEQAMILLELQNRFQRPPFTQQSDHATRVEVVARRLAAAKELLARDDALASLREAYAHAIALSPDDWILKRNAGMMLVARGAPTDAVPLLEQALAWIPDDVDTLIALARAQEATGKAAEAARTFEMARSLEPRHPAFAAKN
jgi:tetratricopeptide (TPR) repeat protein